MSAVSSMVTTLDPPQERKLKVVPKRDPLLVVLAGLLKVLAPGVVAAWSRIRSTVMVVGGMGFLCWAAWMLHPAAGAAAIGLSLLVIEMQGKRE